MPRQKSYEDYRNQRRRLRRLSRDAANRGDINGVLRASNAARQAEMRADAIERSRQYSKDAVGDFYNGTRNAATRKYSTSASAVARRATGGNG